MFIFFHFFKRGGEIAISLMSKSTEGYGQKNEMVQTLDILLKGKLEFADRLNAENYLKSYRRCEVRRIYLIFISRIVGAVITGVGELSCGKTVITCEKSLSSVLL